MDLKDLRSRIDLIKANSNIAFETDIASSKEQTSEQILTDNGWLKVADMVYEKVSVRKNILPKVISSILMPDLYENGIPGQEFVFYDTETTGLSAGAGNMVFLSGFGEVDPENNDFRITQIFLSDFPGEPDFLNYIKKFITPDRIYVSYNGKSFDANVLRTRYAMNGMRVDFGFQLDLLYPARRLWKNIIGSCSLGDIERTVLDKRRGLDVPGYMVPELYFDFLRNRDWKALEGVIAHHLEDIASLAELLLVIEQLFSGVDEVKPEQNYTPTEYFDPLGLSSLMVRKSPESSTTVLMSAFDNGNHRAGVELSIHYKRTGRWQDAIEIWRRMWKDSHSIFAGIELAKYYEHRSHEIEEAYRITCEIMELERIRLLPYLPELGKRQTRLKLKLDKKSGEGRNE